MALFDDLQSNYSLPEIATSNFEKLQEEYYDLFFGGHEATKNLFKDTEQLNPEEDIKIQTISSDIYESFDEPIPVKNNELEQSHLYSRY